MDNIPSRAIRSLTVAIAIVVVVGFIAMSLFFSVGGFWGSLNDLSIAVEALLVSALAWMLHPASRSQSPKLSWVMLAVAILGGLIASLGSAGVMSGVTGWFLAILITSLGYALLAVWLFVFNHHARLHGSLPRGLTRMGQIAGATLMLGFLNIPGILNRIESPADASWLTSISMVGALGWILLPIWSVWLGRVILKSTQENKHE